MEGARGVPEMSTTSSLGPFSGDVRRRNVVCLHAAGVVRGVVKHRAVSAAGSML